MDKHLSLTLDQVDEIYTYLRRAHAVSKLVAECGTERKSWPETFTVIELCTVMHVIAEEIMSVQEMLKVCAKEARQEEDTADKMTTD